MDGSVAVTVVGAVFVSAISAGAALLGQSLAVRTTRREATHARASALRAERKQAVVDFLDAVRVVEHVIDNWRVWPHVEQAVVVPAIADWKPAPPPTGLEGGAAVHQMWFALRKLQLLCSADLARAAEQYADRANDFVWTDIPTEVRHTNFLRDVRDRFLAEARIDLGIPADTSFR